MCWRARPSPAEAGAAAPATSNPSLAAAQPATSDLSLDGAQRRHIVQVLERCGWKVRGPGGAAELLELKAATLESRMKKLGIRRPG